MSNNNSQNYGGDQIQILEGLEMFGEMAVYVLWGASNVAFLLYDLCLDYLFYGFRKWLKPKINKKIRKG